MVPNGWEVRTFGELFSIKSGFGFKYSEYAEKGIPLIKIDNVSHGYVKWDNISYLPISYKDEYSDLLLQEGDLLLALNRPITQGKLKLVKLTKNDVPSILYQRVGRIDFIHKDLEKDFYLYLLDTEVFKFVSQKAIGSDQPFISTTELKKLNIIKPPLPEQRKIAQILSTWDRGIATTEKLIDASKQQKKALMQQLLTGKKRLVDPETGNAFEGEWKVHKLQDICTKTISYGIVQTGENLPNGIPCVRVVDLSKKVMLSSSMIKTSEDIHNSYKKTILCRNEIMIALRGEIGLVRKVTPELVGVNITRGIARLAPTDCVDCDFLLWVLRSNSVKNDLAKKSGGSALQEISLNSLRKVTVLVPILLEQQKIALVLTAADRDIELLNAKLAHFKQEKKALMQQLLTGKRRVALSS